MRLPALRSFKPIIDRRSRVLILGTMPGPEALRKKEYYGFRGNHFWKIMQDYFQAPGPLSYPEKMRLLRKNRIALWDVFQSCVRRGAADSAIQCMRANDIPGLLGRYPGIRAVLLNSRTAEKIYRGYFAAKVKIPAYYLPSTSPAHASLSYRKKYRLWASRLRASLGQ